MNFLNEDQGFRILPSFRPIARTILAGSAALILSACDVSEKKPTEQPSASVNTQQNALRQPAALVKELSLQELLAQLPALIAPFGEVMTIQKSSRAGRPLLILVAEMHGLNNDAGVSSDGVQVQEEVVQIMHTLKAHFPVQIQAMESFPANIQLETIERDSMTLDQRQTAAYADSIVQPMREGKPVIAATFLLEDIYREKLLSVGVEDSYDDIASFFKDREVVNVASTNINGLTEARARVLPKIVAYFHLTPPKTREEAEQLYKVLRGKYATLDAAGKATIHNILMQDPWFAQLMEVAPRYFSSVILGRNKKIATELKHLLSGKENVFFSVGAQHIHNLVQQLGDENVVVLKPHHEDMGFEHPSEQFGSAEAIREQTKKELYTMFELMRVPLTLWNAPR